MDCEPYRGAKLLEHALKIVERVPEKSIRELVKVDDMQFGFMPGKGTTDALFIYFEKDARRVSWKREKAVHVFCRLGKSI